MKKCPDVGRLIKRLARAKTPRARTRLIRRLPWSRMSPQVQIIALRYLPKRNRMKPRHVKDTALSHQRRVMAFIGEYQKANRPNAPLEDRPDHVMRSVYGGRVRARVTFDQ